MQNDYKPLNKFFNDKNANNKVNRWGPELTTYKSKFEWISGAHKKAADCLSHLVEFPQDKPVSINVSSVTESDGPAFNSRCQTHECLSMDTSTSQQYITPDISEAKDPTSKFLTADRSQALL